jgi:hypothetical protein
VKWTRGTLIFGLFFYIFLWLLFIKGASTLLPLLVVPPVLVVLVGGGNFIEHVLGIRHRAPKFRDRDEEK